jgi:hypothetical protein
MAVLHSLPILTCGNKATITHPQLSRGIFKQIPCSFLLMVEEYQSDIPRVLPGILLSGFPQRSLAIRIISRSVGSESDFSGFFMRGFAGILLPARERAVINAGDNRMNSGLFFPKTP